MAQAKSYKEQLAQKRRQWKKHVEAWRASGLSQAQYCRRHNLKVHCLVYWRKKFARKNQDPVSFVQLKLPHDFQVTRPAAIKIAVGRCRIEIQRGFDPETLKQLIHTLGQL
jgi:hypothetical protein